MKQKNKTAVYELEQLRTELEREKKKVHIPFPAVKSRVEKEREQALLEQMNRNQEKTEYKQQSVEETHIPKQQQIEKNISLKRSEDVLLTGNKESFRYDNGETAVKSAVQSQELVELKQELQREKYKSRYASVMRSTVGTLLVVAALAILVATLWMPVLQIYGSSMTPTLKEGQIVVSVKGDDIEQGDLVAFYLGNKLLVKRVIACPADYVDIGRDGTVSVNGIILEEPYVTEKTLGECDLDFPYQVPDSRYFLMGDHRETSIDSRMSAVGCVSKEQVVGKIVCCVWPLTDMKFFE